MKQYIFWSALCCTALASGHTLAACAQSPDCEAMGYKYTADECPNDGVKCPFDTSKYFCFDPQTCDYTYTADACAANCQNPGASSCVRNGVTYYVSCGSSKCSSGQSCYNGTCFTSVSASGWCCDDTGSYCNDYSYCRSNYSHPDCSDVMSSCRASGGTPRFQYCSDHLIDSGTIAHFSCQ